VMPRSGERVHEVTIRSSRTPNNRANLQPRQRAKSYSALCFGYFHLSQQMKVTRPPAETGALLQAANSLCGSLR
jgi:hypothetical protein